MDEDEECGYLTAKSFFYEISDDSTVTFGLGVVIFPITCEKGGSMIMSLFIGHAIDGGQNLSADLRTGRERRQTCNGL